LRFTATLPYLGLVAVLDISDRAPLGEVNSACCTVIQNLYHQSAMFFSPLETPTSDTLPERDCFALLQLTFQNKAL